MTRNSALDPFDGDIMRYLNTLSVRAAILTASLAGVTLFGGCGAQRTAELTQSETRLIFEEIDLGSSLVGYDDPRAEVAGPNLIAGDWLAIQCAQATGFFDSEHWGTQWAPVYAHVVATDFE